MSSASMLNTTIVRSFSNKFTWITKQPTLYINVTLKDCLLTTKTKVLVNSVFNTENNRKRPLFNPEYVQASGKCFVIRTHITYILFKTTNPPTAVLSSYTVNKVSAYIKKGRSPLHQHSSYIATCIIFHFVLKILSVICVCEFCVQSISTSVILTFYLSSIRSKIC